MYVSMQSNWYYCNLFLMEKSQKVLRMNPQSYNDLLNNIKVK